MPPFGPPAPVQFSTGQDGLRPGPFWPAETADGEAVGQRYEERKPRILSTLREPSAVAAREAPPDEAKKMNTGIPMKKKLKMLQTWICGECGLRKGYMDPEVTQAAAAFLECENCGKATPHLNSFRNDTYEIRVPA